MTATDMPKSPMQVCPWHEHQLPEKPPIRNEKSLDVCYIVTKKRVVNELFLLCLDLVG